jgi:hypothetical protein
MSVVVVSPVTPDYPGNLPDTPSNPAVITTGPGRGVKSVAFSPDSRFVACNDYENEKAFDVSSGAALPGAPRWEACLAVERGCSRAARMVRIHRFAAAVAIVRFLAAVSIY